MPVHRPGSRNPEDLIQADINSAHKGVSGIRRQMKRPTIPVYDSTAFPTDPQRGQIVRDINDPTVLWVYGEDDQWHKIGAGTPMTWLALTGVHHNVQNVGHDDHAHFDPNLIHTNGAANWHYEVDGTEIFIVKPITPGLYLVGCDSGWDTGIGVYTKTTTLNVTPYNVGTFGPSVSAFFGRTFSHTHAGSLDGDIPVTNLCYFPQYNPLVEQGEISVSLDHNHGSAVDCITDLWVVKLSGLL